ncbi:MAG: phage holin family protein [Sphingomonadaceae bacterium]|nr:phage holin family protein [Sphingomonadaceae bacterium]
MSDQALPDTQEQEEAVTSAPSSGAERTLSDEIVSLVEDGKTYVEAEIAYQKTRAALAAHSGKNGVIFVFAALAFLHLALIALVVGLVIALAPVVTAWGAVALVVGTLLLGVAIFGLLAAKRFRRVSSVFKEDVAE